MATSTIIKKSVVWESLSYEASKMNSPFETKASSNGEDHAAHAQKLLTTDISQLRVV